MTDTGKGPRLDRRGFMGASALGGAALVGGLGMSGQAAAQAGNPATGAPQVDFPADPRAFGGSGTNRTEMDLRDCEVEGELAQGPGRGILPRRPRSAVPEAGKVCG